MTDGAEPLTRRGFVRIGLGLFAGAYAAAVGYPVYRYANAQSGESAPVSKVALPDADALPAGSALMFMFGGVPATLIHHDDGTWACFEAKCTHRGCEVRFEPENRRIFCGCHEGVYDMRTGEVVSGPPPRPLKSLSVEVRDGEVVVGA